MTPARFTVKVVRSHLKSPVVTVNAERGQVFTSYSEKCTESTIKQTVVECQAKAERLLLDAEAGAA